MEKTVSARQHACLAFGKVWTYVAFAALTGQHRDGIFSSLVGQRVFEIASIVSTFLGLSSSGDPRYITVQNENHVGFEDLWMSCDSDAPVCIVIAADAHVRANHLDNTDGKLVTELC